MAQDDIQGQVVDGAGNPVEDAIVELTRSYQSNPADEQVVLRTTTDSNGEYRFFYHPDGDGTTQEWHVSAYSHDGTAYVNSFNNPGVTAELPSNAIPDSVIHQYQFNSGSGATITDVTGSDDLSLFGTYTWLSDGINFNGGYAEGVKDYSALYTQFSLSADIEINTSDTPDLFCGLTRDIGPRYGFVLSNDLDKWEIFVTDENGNQDTVRSDTITETTRLRATLTYDNGDYQFYVGDSLIYDETNTGLSGALTDSTDLYYLFVGGDPNDSNRTPDVDFYDLYVADAVWGTDEINQVSG